MHFHIITLFPKAFDSYLGESILKRAIEDKKIKVSFYNPRDFTKDKWKRIDRPPYAGGPGMVIQAEPVIKAIQRAKGLRSKVKIIFLTPSGKQFTNSYAASVAKKYKDVIIVSGRYEGIDARVKKVFKTDEVSIGPFVLTGGELPAQLIIDTISRHVPGVLGNLGSIEESRTASPDVYTRPESFKYKGKAYAVPKVLLSGNHAKIEEWKSKRKTDK
ncbi:tRNA (guanosine(37)-N1)-methyltransferase TrmD [Candidatus Parcubacteria bacterium]|nr:tRNA (guanosine(37)-N1)-methyltransferase TrmD [Candidatus Parcubacteria bacterium]